MFKHPARDSYKWKRETTANVLVAWAWMEHEGSRTGRGNRTEGRTIIEEGSTKLTNRFLTLHELPGMSGCHEIR